MRDHLILKFGDKVITDITINNMKIEMLNAGIIHVEMSCNYMRGFRLDTNDKQMGLQMIHCLYAQLSQILEDKQKNNTNYPYGEKI